MAGGQHALFSCFRMRFKFALRCKKIIGLAPGLELVRIYDPKKLPYPKPTFTVNLPQNIVIFHVSLSFVFVKNTKHALIMSYDNKSELHYVSLSLSPPLSLFIAFLFGMAACLSLYDAGMALMG